MTSSCSGHSIAQDGPPASPERASGSELAHMAQLASENPLFPALMDWIDGLVLVLNRHRQIVLAGDDVAEALHVDSPEGLIGMRLGEALGCTFSDMTSGGCGTTPNCRYCGALKAILDATRFDAPVEAECRVTMRANGHTETLKLHAKTSRASRKSEPFTVAVLQRADRIGRAATLAAETDLTEDWPIGIEAYDRVRKLGTGGMGSVFLVRDDQKREFAVKTVKASLAEDEAVMARFLREIRLSIVLNHPNIVRTLRANQTATGTVYMVTEFCPKGSAGQWLQRHGPLAPDVALTWLIGCTRALRYAWHEHHLIHRDIKPDNLLLGTDDQPKLADFGVAKRSLATDPRLTNVRTFVGSVHYMAPEQAISATDVDTRADLYGLGSTFFELLSGQTPFDGPAPADILRRKMRQKAPHLGSLRPHIPVDLADTVQSLLATDPEDRPSDPDVLLQRLARVASSAGVPFVPELPG